MNKQSVLPAILMSLTASASLPTPGSAAAAGNGAAGASSSAKPIVALFTASNEAVVPQRLDTWANELAARTGYSAQHDGANELPRCGTISGSGNGWDDSKQDC